MILVTLSQGATVAPIKGTHGIIYFWNCADAKPEVLYILDREKAIGRSEGRAPQLFDNPLVAATPKKHSKATSFTLIQVHGT